MRVLGIDCGSQITGFGIIDSDAQRHLLVVSGAIRLQRRKCFSEKLLDIHREIDQLITTYGPQILAVEDQFYLSNFKSVLKLGQVKGAVILTAARAGIPIVEYSPLEIKSAVTGYGRAEKRQVQTMVEKLLRLAAPPEPLDASDALALAICHVHTSATQVKIQKAALVAVSSRHDGASR
ncbi:MAG: crossover junction endodeoxyribonuclease RuvC [Terriglobia bacterium]